MMQSSERSKAALSVVGVIPARMESVRLPGKVLRPICGRPMVHHVFERASACRYLTELWVATDSQQVHDYCTGNQIPVLMTSPDHRSGTERIHEVMQMQAKQKQPADIYVNVQGDEPMLQSTHLDLLIEPFVGNMMTQVTTLKTPLSPGEAQNPNVVKVVTDGRGKALYFSRAAIPFRHHPCLASPGSPNLSWNFPYFKHLGLYAYRPEALDHYACLPVSPLEETERLEQLRFLENGIPIRVSETSFDTIGVDTEEDFEVVTRYFESLSVRR
jgi:3-deoxy-manno-octulosonate cytidylyltransferase (CMP-KDO synthetase)